MFDRVEKQRTKLIKKATPITRKQYLRLRKVLEDIGLSYTMFFDGEDKVMQLSNDVFIAKDYFSDFRLPSELVESIE